MRSHGGQRGGEGRLRPFCTQNGVYPTVASLGQGFMVTA